MKIVEYDIEDGLHLASVYNAQIADGSVPHCHPITEDEFEVGMTQRTRDDRPVKTLGLHSLSLIAVERDGKSVGFAHIAVETRTWEDPVVHHGAIRVFTVSPEDRKAGQQLLEACEARLAEHPIQAIFVSPWFAPVRFMHSGREEISTAQPHLLALIRLNGYEPDREQYIMDADQLDLDEPTSPDKLLDVAVETTESRGRLPNYAVRLTQDGEEIGQCVVESRGQFVRAETAQTSLYIHDLEIEERAQGRGYGRYLLRRALWEGRRLGFTDATLCVLPENFRAVMLYAAEGFRIAATGYQLRKSVHQESRSE